MEGYICLTANMMNQDLQKAISTNSAHEVSPAIGVAACLQIMNSSRFAVSPEGMAGGIATVVTALSGIADAERCIAELQEFIALRRMALRKAVSYAE